MWITVDLCHLSHAATVLFIDKKIIRTCIYTHTHIKGLQMWALLEAHQCKENKKPSSLVPIASQAANNVHKRTLTTITAFCYDCCKESTNTSILELGHSLESPLSLVPLSNIQAKQRVILLPSFPMLFLLELLLRLLSIYSHSWASTNGIRKITNTMNLESVQFSGSYFLLPEYHEFHPPLPQLMKMRIRSKNGKKKKRKSKT